jgi:D-aminoacyl-tRNA deacylase
MPVLLFTSNNEASLNIAQKLIENHGFVQKNESEWEKDGVKLIDTKAPTVLDVPTDFETDYLLVLSSHKSKSGKRMLTAHLPGNWGEAKFGGEPKTLNIAYGSRIKIIIEELSRANDIDWPVFMEADHHGPTCRVPIIFVEIGSTEKEWSDENAGRVVAQAVGRSLERTEKYESVFGVGGGHYTREFTKMLLETEYAVGHVAPKYVLDDLDFDVFRQAVEKNVETVRKVFLLKESTNRRHKRKISEFCSKLGLEYTEI